MTDSRQGALLARQIEQGFELLRQGRLVDAARLSDELLRTHRSDAQAMFYAAEVHVAAGDAESALGLLDQAIAAAPGQPTLLLRKAGVLVSLRRRVDARRIADQAVASSGEDARTLWGAGKIHGSCGDQAAARKLYERAAASAGENPSLTYDLALCDFFLGDFRSAETRLDTYLKAAPQAGHALYLRSILRRQDQQDNHVADLRKRLAVGFGDEAGRAACLYALAKELEDLGDDEQSFASLNEGASTKRRSLRYEVAPELETMDAICAAYPADVIHSSPGPSPAVDAPIFIVGMPRTGTTLAEQTLARHSQVASAGELLDFSQVLAAAVQREVAGNADSGLVEASLKLDFAALGQDYIRGAREAASPSPVFIDKMPVNFLYCGLIRRALPNARIIHLVRDPMDTCYAIYKTMFNQAYHFSCQFDELAAYYAAYRRMMQHWHSAMPGAILDVRYEDLVTDLEGSARSMLAWCNLDWEQEVLSNPRATTASTTASAAQVREPVYSSSIGKWKRFESQLAPLRARLAAAGVATAP